MYDEVAQTTAKRESSVHSGLNTFELHIDRLENAISSLQERCSVLQVPTPSYNEMPGSDGTSPANSQLGARIAGLGDSLDNQIRRLIYTIDSIDL